MTVYEAIVKVRRDDPPARRARDIEAGIAYACALLRDEYELSPDEISGILERIADEVADNG